MVKYLFAGLILSLLLQSAANLQENKISEKQTELKNLKEEINKLQKDLDVKTRNEKESFTAIENYNRQGHLLNKMINNIREEEALKQKQILNNEDEIKTLRSEISKLQDNYANYVRAIYKYGDVPEWAVLVDAGSLNRALLRIQYLRRFAQRREKDLNQLQQNKQRLITATGQLEKEKQEKSQLALQKEEEEKSLKTKLDERKKILAAIRNDKAELKKELSAKKEAEVVIKNLITKLVEETERKRKEEAERLALLQKEKLLADSKSKETVKELRKEPETSYDVDLTTSSFSSFAAARGKLSWPLSGGTVFKKYGENRNKKLNTVTMNYGIDIKAGKDLNVKSVADGVISAVEWVPGFGSVIIVTHKGDYRTVYGHLSEIYIKEGDRVKKGTLIAKTAEGTEGNILHFEIWNSRNNQDPELWLSKK